MPPEGIDSLGADSLKSLVLSLLAKIDELLEQNKTLLARIAELEARAGKPPKTPTNPSLPPSSGQKANVAASATKKSRKGRPGVTRALCPNPDVTPDIYAERCDCGATVPRTGQVLAHAYDHVELELETLAHDARQEPAHGMLLLARGLHHRGNRCPMGRLQHGNHARLLRARIAFRRARGHYLRRGPYDRRFGQRRLT
jgi:hypothetical protein